MTAVIHAPDLGSHSPAEPPTTISGTLMPAASENNAVPPSATSRVWLMNTSAPASGALTQGLTISADTAPIANTPAAWPAGRRFECAVMRVANAAGRRSS